MKLFKFEVLKIFHNKTIFFALILIVANILVCAKVTAPTEDEVALKNGFDQLLQEYAKDPTAYRAKVNSLAKEYSEKLIETDPTDSLFGIDPRGKNGLPSEISKSSVYTDLFVYARVLSVAGKQTDFENDIKKLLVAARTNLEMYEREGIESYNYKYQKIVIEKYEHILKTVKLGHENVRGWDDYFNYDAVNIFIVATIIIICGAVFTGEKHTGMPMILRCSKKGGSELARAKIVAAMVVSLVVVIMFSLSSFVVIGITNGYSSMFNAAQVIPSLRYMQMTVNVGIAFALFNFVKIIAFLLMTAFVVLISFCFYNYLTVYAVSGAVFGFNMILQTFQYRDLVNPLKYINIVSAAEALPLLSRYRGVDLFGFVIDILVFWLFISLVLMAAIIIFILFIVSKKTGGVAFNAKGGSFSPLRIRSDKQSKSDGKNVKTGIPAIFRFEIYKLFCANKFIWLLLIAFVLHGAISNHIFPAPKKTVEAMYKEYCEKLYGPITEEKIEYIQTEHSYITETLDKFETMMQKRNSFEISEDEFGKYLEEYDYARKREVAINRIKDHSDYLDKKLIKTGVAGWFYYDTGWYLKFGADISYILIVLIVAAATLGFCGEYANGFSSILQLTRYGRRETFISKMGVIALTGVTCSILFTALDFALVILRYGAEGINSPLLSLESFKNYNGSMTLGEYLIIELGVRIVGAAMISLAAGAVSQLMKKQITTVIVCFLAALMPPLLRNMGVSFLFWIDISALLNPTDIFSNSFKLYLFGAFGYVALFMLLCSIAFATTLYLSSRDFNGRRMKNA